MNVQHFTESYFFFEMRVMWLEVKQGLQFVKNRNEIYITMRNVKHSKIIQTMMEYRHCVCAPPGT